ncbi:hypothetical protein Cpap_1602 [Ruminiclostridium papyrosolvens DSM 2782]|uniref:Uncharacterized protein n=1 Tax=Ruminiclostridium papyrosolvens DSM 2782 TaxID=588581 RepID=F1TEP3_9FIRM|nr:hypothetical protein [Ruminiclostridium papyrosolvens]EGD47209.1 hypothetical protein Cpap_1602 [Ruminiclostridium papyrosolvens DSM 2782]WES36248.1 hypothetical protein P0092_09850 [Ruminiclostridium papyrosolvens DSM 2782]
MDLNTVIAILAVLLSVYLTIELVLKYRIKKEQIKADVLVRTEEVKAKNQLEIEKLIHQDNIVKEAYTHDDKHDINNDEKQNGHRSRINDRF